jgi:predicted RNA polymerase sigma factor
VIRPSLIQGGRLPSTPVDVAARHADASPAALPDTLAATSSLAQWAQLHIARAALLAETARRCEAVSAHRAALALGPAPPARQLIVDEIAALTEN